jgi:xanthine dehydrogenase YagT iron-sulfur-binding subunit
MSHSDQDGGGVSRRTFIQGAGGAVAGGALIAIPAEMRGQAQTQPAGRAGISRYPAGGQRVTLDVNGSPRAIFITPETTLLDALREEMDLTGAKEGCGRGACGACTVMVDGKAVNSCMMLALDAIGRKIVTVEGLAKDGKLDPVQQAFVEHDACQCGYCIPGFIISARAMLDETPRPDREQIKQGLCGNICRCGTYVRIFDAVEAAARGGQG